MIQRLQMLLSWLKVSHDVLSNQRMVTHHHTTVSCNTMSCEKQKFHQETKPSDKISHTWGKFFLTVLCSACSTSSTVLYCIMISSYPLFYLTLVRWILYFYRICIHIAMVIVSYHILLWDFCMIKSTTHDVTLCYKSFKGIFVLFVYHPWQFACT